MRKTVSFFGVARIMGCDHRALLPHKDALPGQVLIGKRIRYFEDEIIAFFENGGFLRKDSPVSISDTPKPYAGA